ncbi:MAG: UdgX family uracil-DNA binding protein [Caulobacteraceae bacterium]
MRAVRLASATDFEGWRKAARGLRGAGVRPEEVYWAIQGDDTLLPAETPPSTGKAKPFSVPPAFVAAAAKAALHRSPDRFALMYRILWRLAWEPHLMQVATDPDVMRLAHYERQVNQAIHKMHAFVRFREIRDEAGMLLAAWFEPPHLVTEAAAPHFVKRYSHSRFSLLTPDRVALWDMQTLSFGPGVTKDQAPAPDALEAYWKTYYASIFNPARLNPKVMMKEMPKRYWGNLPEAELIPDLIASANSRTADMVAQSPATPSPRAARQAQRIARDGAFGMDAPSSLEDVVAQVDVCRRCDLWKEATQGVAGEGAARARLMLVGEQPGDQEDLAGRPFVGPAGQLLDKAMDEAGVVRKSAYVTNAVKHFKHEPRGKRRLHKTPNAGEVSACRWWLEAERRLVKPKVIVCLGATAALSVMGRPTPVADNRGKPLDLPDGARVVVTYHPSYLLRVPDPVAKAEAYRALISDLKQAQRIADAP